MKRLLSETKGFTLIEGAVVSSGIVTLLVAFMFLMSTHVVFERRTQEIAEYSQLVGSVKSILTSMAQVSLEISLYDSVDEALNSNFGALSDLSAGNVARLDINPNRGVILFMYTPGDTSVTGLTIPGLYYLPIEYNFGWSESAPVLISSKMRAPNFIALFNNCESPSLKTLTIASDAGKDLDDVEGAYCTSSPKINFLVTGALDQLIMVPLSPLYY
jgi:hypothetical protein